ncbi:hypothetical protein BH11BAC7_BH11BAC7_01460 [soil metagenome]
MKTNLLAAMLILPLFFITSCKKENLNALRNGQVIVRLANDSVESALEEVNLDVRNVEVRIAGTTGGDWYKLHARTGIYNIIALSNGIDALLVNEKVPTGEIMAVRLNLGTNNSVRKSGVLYPVSIPEGDDAGLTYEFYKTIDASTAEMQIIFNAAESVYQDGPQLYRLRPVIRVK